MAEKTTKTIWIFLIILGFISVLWLASIKGYLPITYTEVKSARGLISFLDSPRDDMRGIKVNNHFLEIGKRPSLQILKPYDHMFYMMRPYRKVRLIPRNMTKAEVVDFCLGITGDGFIKLKSQVPGPDYPVVWTGKAKGREIKIRKVTLFTYIVYGLRDRPLFISQVELAKRLGIADQEIMKAIIPVQNAWYSRFMNKVNSVGSSFPSLPHAEDALIAMLKNKGKD